MFGFRLSLGPRLIFTFMIVVLVALVIPTYHQVRHLSGQIYGESRNHMESDLEISELVLNKKQRSLLLIARTLSHDMSIGIVLNHEMPLMGKAKMIKGSAKRFLMGFSREDMSFVTIVDRDGEVLFRSENEYEILGDPLKDDPFVTAALSGDEVSAYAIMESTELWQEGLIRDVPPKSTKVSGLLLKAAIPIYYITDTSSAQNILEKPKRPGKEGAVGAVIVGYWLNRDKSVMAEIKRRTKSEASIFTPSGLVGTTGRDWTPLVPNVSFDADTSVNRRFLNYDSRGEIAGYLPLRDIHDEPIGLFELRSSTAFITRARNQVMKNAALYMAIGLLSSMLLGLIMTRNITTPIRTMQRGAEEIGRGNLQHRIHVPGNDEISGLAEAFNIMAIRLHQSMEEMVLSKQQVEEYSRRLKSAHASLEMYSRELEKVNQQLLESNTRLQKANEVKDTFLSTVSHELKTPLTTIIGYLSMMIEGALGGMSEEQNQAVAVMYRRGRNLQDLIADLLSLSRLDAGKLELRTRYVDLATELRNTEEVFRERLKEAGLQILLSIPERLPRVSADSERLAQVIYNLVGNAIKFTPAGGAITLRVAHPPDANYVIISVTDTGIGIPETELAHIFDRFYQIDRRDGREFPGTGLGLAIAKELVELHGGRIWAESKGHGSVFSFTLPIQQING